MGQPDSRAETQIRGLSATSVGYKWVPPKLKKGTTIATERRFFEGPRKEELADGSDNGNTAETRVEATEARTQTRSEQ